MVLLENVNFQDFSNVEVRPKSMHVFDRWRPQRLVGHGDRLVLAALDLLRAHRVQLSQLERLHAQELLDQ